MENKFELIAETAFSHEGDFEYLKSQVKAAKDGSADYVKFQVFLDKDQSYCKDHKFYAKIDDWMFSAEQWQEILKYAKSLGLKVLVLPLNVSSLNFCVEYDDLVDAYELHSISLNELHMLKILSLSNKKVILGVGGHTEQEIDFAIEHLKQDKIQIILMFGFQSFPTDLSTLELSKLNTLKLRYKTQLGYADHTSYDDEMFYNLNDYAFLHGVRLFEKHIVVERGQKRIDYESAVALTEFIKMRERLDLLNSILGNDDIAVLNNKESVYGSRQKVIVAARDLNIDETLQMDDLLYKVSDQITDLKQNDILKMLGKKLLIPLKKDQAITIKHWISK